MLFNSLEFFVFLGAVLVIHATLPPRARKALLLVASYIFYGAWDWRFLGLIALSTMVDFLVGLRLSASQDPSHRRTLLATSLVVNLSLLGYFKYAGFFVESFQQLLTSLGYTPTVHAFNIILPVGISFYTFQTLSYTIDVYRGNLKATQSLLDFALYVAFFPQLVAGPIERASHFLPQIQRSPRPSRDEVISGAWLVLWGTFKKVVVADNLATLVDMVYGASHPYGAEVLVATYAFAVQIYCDFSGYTDIARGVARLLGFDLMLNFRLPYSALDPSDFWRRWHISLSTWLRDYLYIPLGGNRHGTWRTYRNLFLTMLLGGLWHGAAWTYVAWGAYHGCLLATHRALRSDQSSVPPARTGVQIWARRFVMFHLVCLGWMLFRADSISHFAALAGTLLSTPNLGLSTQWLLPLTVLLTPLLAYEALQVRWNSLEPITNLGHGSKVALCITTLLTIVILGEDKSAPFIYFQF